LSALLKAHPVWVEQYDAESPCCTMARPHLWLEWAGTFAFVLAIAAMLLFMMNTIANRVGTLLAEQNAAALKLSNNLHYFNADAPIDSQFRRVCSRIWSNLPARPRSLWTRCIGCSPLNTLARSEWKGC
jgi:hypothetical protein